MLQNIFNKGILEPSNCEVNKESEQMVKFLFTSSSHIDCNNIH